MMRIEITTKERRLVFFLPLSLLGAQIVAKSIRRNLRDDRTHALASADEGAQSPILPPPADGQAEAAIASPEVLIPESGTPAGPESAPVPEAEAPHEDLPVGKLRPVFRQARRILKEFKRRNSDWNLAEIESADGYRIVIRV